MAKFGEGDPRWIVEHRDDGRNINNWHWTETDCMGWAKARLGELCSGLVLLDATEGGTGATTTEVKSVKGEAFVNQRKGKMIVSYELEMRIGWAGEVRDAEGGVAAKGKGTVHLPYLGVENEDETPEVRVEVEVDDKVGAALKEAIRTKGKKNLLDALSKFTKELKAGGPVKPLSGEVPQAQGPTTEAPVEASTATVAAASVAAPGNNGSMQKVKKTKGRSKGKLHMEERFYGSPRDLYECFTNPGKMQAFTQSAAKVDVRPDGEFSWFGGSVSGRFIELEQDKKLSMKWRFNNWEEGCFSQVVLDFDSPATGTTVVKLQQSGIPSEDRYGNEDVIRVTENGWRTQIFHRIRGVFGYGI
ncbi:unnamed protein product [Ostreobium quekettii]|uniref:Activator of Hsp90 ATPase AHSA1-like N-terminal domain-containing protein n=1 Tax=Ostreobium quekettii TaxID=121088 RepID=A0A8S1J3B4_9CHLO|nr:unnamed protein product [Ostreobium quekettii]|eukprot:evm.model.scf_384EXC.5 EVM.evm.TU.scf_384EXC.5   scf_384EXC:43867-46945(+)